MDNATYNRVAEMWPGDRVELHPACDMWMRGARFGTITKVAKTFVWVKLDKAARPLRFRADLVQPID